MQWRSQDTEVARAQELHVGEGSVSGVDELARSTEKILAFIFHLPELALMAPSWLAGEPGAVQNWLFSC